MSRTTTHEDGERESCGACHGSGRMLAECCSGYRCECRGQAMDLGTCLECHGYGEVDAGHQYGANVAAIYATAEGNNGRLAPNGWGS